jgi:hypothetical protein
MRSWSRPAFNLDGSGFVFIDHAGFICPNGLLPAPRALIDPAAADSGAWVR